MPKANALTDENKRFIIKHSKEMSITEIGIEIKQDKELVKRFCYRVSAASFTECKLNWKRHNYIKGENDYAMYPFQGAYKQSSTVTNAMLEGK